MMHDPSTVAFEIRYPWRKWGNSGRNNFERKYRESFITIWHEDPETDGSDDSCGWFKRARHCDQMILKAIESDFTFNWCQSWGGWFNEDGSPRLSVSAIALDMIGHAAFHHFGKDRRKRDRFLRKHLPSILIFAENTTDSLHVSITGRYGVERDKAERIHHFAAIVYPWVVRANQKWWQHARWHFWHWRFQIHPLQKLKRRLFQRCDDCGKPFGWNESPVGTWGGDKLWHSACMHKASSVAPSCEAAE